MTYCSLDLENRGLCTIVKIQCSGSGTNKICISFCLQNPDTKMSVFGSNNNFLWYQSSEISSNFPFKIAKFTMKPEKAPKIYFISEKNEKDVNILTKFSFF